MRSTPRFLSPADFTPEERNVIYSNAQTASDISAKASNQNVFAINEAQFYRTKSFGDVLVLHYFVPSKEADGQPSSTQEMIVLDLPDKFRPELGATPSGASGARQSPASSSIRANDTEEKLASKHDKKGDNFKQFCLIFKGLKFMIQQYDSVRINYT
jgi:hypothetical protein